MLENEVRGLRVETARLKTRRNARAFARGLNESLGVRKKRRGDVQARLITEKTVEIDNVHRHDELTVIDRTSFSY